MRTLTKSQPGEYSPYAGMYMELLADDRLALPHLADNFSGNWQYSYGLPQEKLQHRYADGRRNIKEILVRVVDSERIFAYRHYALCGTDIKR